MDLSRTFLGDRRKKRSIEVMLMTCLRGAGPFEKTLAQHGYPGSPRPDPAQVLRWALSASMRQGRDRDFKQGGAVCATANSSEHSSGA